MNHTISYEDAIKRCDYVVEHKEIGVDIFGCSTALAVVFDLPKQQTLNDIAEYRRKKLGIKKPLPRP
jgi:hypothetical protein